MKKIGFIYDEIFLKHSTPIGHPETKERLVVINNELNNSDLWNNLIHIPPKKATIEDIALVHSKNYIENLKNFGSGYLDRDTFMSKNTLDAAFYAVGAVTTALEKIKDGEIQRAFCSIRPPGHHAEINKAMGFCIFNNIAVGARYAQKIGFKKVFIIDFDAHHGNGTQHIFESDSTVFYFSTHQYPFYPGTGKKRETGKDKGVGFTYNVEMQFGSGDKEFIEIYQDILPSTIKKFFPDIILVSAGYDLHKDDEMSGLEVSNEGVRAIVQSILASFSCPMVFALEGGYNLKALADCVRITIEEMLN